MAEKQDLVRFTIDEPEFDQKKYQGRFMSFLKTCNPLDAFYSNQRIVEMQKLIKEQKEKEEKMLKETGDKHVLLTRAQIKEIRTAETVVKTAIHPDTGEFIPWAMRLSSFVPMNLPISFGMIITAPTPFNTIFWQWVNQTYNAVLNYGNRNASSNYTTNDIMKSYGYACASSISVALGIRKMLSGKTKHMKGAKLIVFNSISAFFACSTAGFLNAYFMRQTELEKGISIVDPSNPEVDLGKSKAAAH